MVRVIDSQMFLNFVLCLYFHFKFLKVFIFIRI